MNYIRLFVCIVIYTLDISLRLVVALNNALQVCNPLYPADYMYQLNMC